MSPKRRPILCRFGIHDRYYVIRYLSGRVEVYCSRCGHHHQTLEGT